MILLIRDLWNSLPQREGTLQGWGEAGILTTLYWSCFSEDLKEKPSQERSLWTASLRTNNKRRARLPVGLISLFINQSSNLPELLNTNSAQVVESVFLASWEWETLFYVFECCSQSLTLRAGTIVEGSWGVGKGGVCLKIKKKKISFSPRSL